MIDFHHCGCSANSSMCTYIHIDATMAVAIAWDRDATEKIIVEMEQTSSTAVGRSLKCSLYSIT